MTYPPTPTPAITVAPKANDAGDVSSECILCLSSPREVVLLPCRHLVACKDCALNMVEYGAGGQLVHPTEGTETTAATGPAGADAAEGEAPAEGSGTNAEGDGAAAVAPAPAPAQAPRPPRRKRRAKGWYCPICRQCKHSPLTTLYRNTALTFRPLALNVTHR
jgi:hypothetical protein